MLLNGINHVATLTNDTDRLHDFYREVFQAHVVADMQAPEGPGIRLSIIDIGGGTALNVFQIDGNVEASRQTPMFARGRVDFGAELSLFFRDPDGLEGEVLVENPDAGPGVINPPGTPSARYSTAT